jgi:hypothetical protein
VVSYLVWLWWVIDLTRFEFEFGTVLMILPLFCFVWRITFAYLVVCKWQVLSKWFYDTSPGTTTRAVRGGSLIEGTKALDAQARWTRWFTWFEPPERNTIHPRENGSCIVQALTFFSQLTWVALREHVQYWSLSEPFIAQGRAVTMRPKTRQVASDR